MRPTRLLNLLVLPLLLLATGCVSKNKGVIEGTRWRSVAATIQPRGAVSPAGVSRSVRLPAGHMELDFNKDGRLFYIIANKLHAGKYTLGGGYAVTMHLDEPLAGLKTHTETIVIEGSKLTMTDSDGTQLTFHKVN